MLRRPPARGGVHRELGHSRAPRTDRIGCLWSNRNFIDPDAEIVDVPRGDILECAEREGATCFVSRNPEDRDAHARVAWPARHRHSALLGVDDQRQPEPELPVYDALYAWAQRQISGS
jgi:hypothetical protein